MAMARSPFFKLALGAAAATCAYCCSVAAFAFTAPLLAWSSTGGVRSSQLAQRAGCSKWDRRARFSVVEATGRKRYARAGMSPGAGAGVAARGGRGLFMEQETLILTEENVVAVLAEAKSELSTLFGNNAENTAVGITGDVEFVCLDGPSVVVRLTGRFWHEKTTVLARVANYVLKRIPECIDVEIEDPSQLEDADPQGRGQGAEM